MDIDAKELLISNFKAKFIGDSSDDEEQEEENDSNEADITKEQIIDFISIIEHFTTVIKTRKQVIRLFTVGDDHTVDVQTYGHVSVSRQSVQQAFGHHYLGDLVVGDGFDPCW